MLAFVSNRETLKTSWRNKGEMWMCGMHVVMWCSSGALLFGMPLQGSGQVMSWEC
jgi:hypothetical protein